MKKILFIGILLIYGISNSQEYIPMLDDSNKWSLDIYFCPFYPPEFPTWTVTYQFEIEGSVEINGILYSQIYRDDDIYCLLREENEVVYKYIENTNSEVVLFDFNINIGTTINLYDNDDNYSFNCSGYYLNSFTDQLEVFEIETQFIAGANRKVIKFLDADFPQGGEILRWIEGIGTSAGLENPWEDIDITCGSKLACFETNGVSYFMYGATSCDNTTLSIDNQNTLKNIIVYPNPVYNISILQFPLEAEIDQLIIYDVYGSIINHESITKDYYKLNSMKYASGLYLYQVLSKGSIIKTDQFIVK